MPRYARIVIPGYLYHITQRGNYKQNIFEEDRDCVIYLKLIQEYSKKYGVEMYAYCLMDNHVHFIAKPRHEESLARTFCVAHQRYSHYFHKKRGIRGHLWQKRFYSCILHGSHLKQAVRYVENNPVRANLAAHPCDYHWSSVKAHLGLAYKIIELSDIREYISFSSWKEYLLEEEKDEELKQIRKMTLKNSILGPVEFIKKVEELLKRKILSNPRGRPQKISPCH